MARFENPPAPPKSPTPAKLFEFILGMPGVRLEGLTVEKLHELRKEREAIDDLIDKLREKATAISGMDEGEQMEAVFRDTASDVLKEWQSDKVNLRGYAREVFGLDKTSKLATDFLGKVTEKTLTGLTAGPPGGCTAE